MEKIIVGWDGLDENCCDTGRRIAPLRGLFARSPARPRLAYLLPPPLLSGMRAGGRGGQDGKDNLGLTACQRFEELHKLLGFASA